MTMQETVVTETLAAATAAAREVGSPFDRVFPGLPTADGESTVAIEAATVESARRIARETVADRLAANGVRLGAAEARANGSKTQWRIMLIIPTDERISLAEDLARWAGADAERVHDEDVAAMPEGRHYTHCCMHARESAAHGMYAFAMELPMDELRRRHASELTERAIARAKREGAI